MANKYFIVLDLGRRRDHSAIAVVERVEQVAPRESARVKGVLVRYVERVPLGTSYLEVVERVREIATDYWVKGNCSVVVDATGVGEPVVDMLRQAKLGCEIVAVTITGGDRENDAGSTSLAPRCSVPKRDLIEGLQVLLEMKQLRIAADIPHLQTLVKELLDMRVTLRGVRVRIGAEGPGEHDDLAIALALAVWKAKKTVPYLNGVGWAPGLMGYAPGGPGDRWR
jgi:hypothetical protein